MNSESSSEMSTPEMISYINCYICKSKIKNENFHRHYNKCKLEYLNSEKSKYYPLKEPNNINELINIISNYQTSEPRILNEINKQFLNLHEEMNLFYSEKIKKSMTPNEYFKIHKENFLRRFSYNNDNSKIKHFFSVEKIKFKIKLTYLELKKIKKDEIENMRTFSINI